MSEQGKRNEVSIQQGTANIGSTIHTNTSGGVSVVGSTVVGNVSSTTNYYYTGRPLRACPTPPPAPDVFVGRSRELAELKRLLQEEQASVVLRGLGGVGKTSLTRQVAHDLYHNPAEKCLRAVLWTEVKPQPDARSLLLDWAAQCDPALPAGLANRSDQQLVAVVRSNLTALIDEACADCTGGFGLVVLDDVWEDGIAAVKLLLQARPANSRVLITTRSIKVARLCAKQLDLDRLPTDEGLALVRRYLPDLPEAGLVRLVNLLGGHALALTIAANGLREESNPANALLRLLSRYETGLSTGSSFADLNLELSEDDKEDNLRLALGYSYEALNEAQQNRFRALGALAYDQPFDLALLAALWQPSQEDQTAKWAEELRRLSLLDAAERDLGEGWYSQHPLLHAYAHALLKTNSAEYAQAQEGYQEKVIEIAESFRSLQPQNWSRLALYFPHIHFVGDYLVAQFKLNSVDKKSVTRILNFCRSITRYLAVRREVDKEKWLQTGLLVSKQLQDHKNEGLFFNELGLLYLDQGKTSQAIEYFEKSLALRQKIVSKPGVDSTLSNIGRTYSIMGDKKKALEYYEKSLPLRREVGNFWGEATTLTNIGRIYAQLGQHEKALDYYKQALPLRRFVGDKQGEAITLSNIGLTYLDQEDYSKALMQFQAALSLQIEIGDKRNGAASLYNIADTYYKRGELREALNYLGQCVEMMIAVRHPYLEQDQQLLSRWQAELAEQEKVQ